MAVVADVDVALASAHLDDAGGAVLDPVVDRTKLMGGASNIASTWIGRKCFRVRWVIWPDPSTFTKNESCCSFSTTLPVWSNPMA